MKRAFIAAVAACASACACAQAIYRCGSTYSEQPCADGVAVQAVAPPSAADVAAARRETERQAKAADAMEKARLKEEAKPVSVYIPKEKAQPAVKASSKPEVFVARVPGEKKKAASKKKPH